MIREDPLKAKPQKTEHHWLSPIILATDVLLIYYKPCWTMAHFSGSGWHTHTCIQIITQLETVSHKQQIMMLNWGAADSAINPRGLFCPLIYINSTITSPSNFIKKKKRCSSSNVSYTGTFICQQYPFNCNLNKQVDFVGKNEWIGVWYQDLR